MKSAADSMELLKSITTGKTCPPLLLACIPDTVRRERLCTHLIEKFLPKDPANPRAGAVFLDAKGMDQRQLAAFRDDLSSLSLFSPFRIFFIRNVDELSSSLTESLVKALDADLTGVSCICLASSLPASSVIMKFFKKKDAAAILDTLEGTELTRWVQKELKNQGIQDCEASAIEHLISIGEGSPDRIVQLIAHVSLYTDGDKLTKKDVQTLFSDSLDASEFDFVDALMQKNAARSESLLQVLLASGKNPFMLVSLLQRSFSTYVSIAALLKDGKNPAEAGQILKIPPWLLRKHLTVVQKHPIQQLKRCVEALVRVDSKLKNRSLGTESIFSEFVYNVTHEV